MSFPSPPTSDERRQYFRIKNSLFMSYETIDTNDNKQTQKETLAEPSPSLRLLKELNEIEQNNKTFLTNLPLDHKNTSTYINQLNSKISSLSEYLVQNLDIKYKELLEVDLSGGGIRFESESELHKDQELKLDIVLVPEYRDMIIHGKVVNSQKVKNKSTFEHSVTFCHIQESDRDAIIKHVFKTQSEQLRADKDVLNPE